MDLGLLLQLTVNGLMSGGIYALIAAGFTLILGVIQVFNFSQGQFYMLGAYVTFGIVTSLGLPYPRGCSRGPGSDVPSGHSLSFRHRPSGLSPMASFTRCSLP